MKNSQVWLLGFMAALITGMVAKEFNLLAIAIVWGIVSTIYSFQES